MATVVFAATFSVLIGNVADVAPAATLTDAGRIAALFPLERLIVRPSFGAGPVKLMVASLAVPPWRAGGLRLIDAGPSGTRVNVAVVAMMPRVAVMVDST